jgi:cell division protein FtsZ
MESASKTSTLKKPKVKIIGLGGAGGFIVDQLQLTEEFLSDRVILDTDIQSLNRLSMGSNVYHLGQCITRGCSTGSDLSLGQEVCEAEEDNLRDLISDSDLLFLVVGLGGGTGTALSIKLAKIASQRNILTFIFGILPFSLEGSHRQQRALDAQKKLAQYGNTFIRLPNDLLLQEVDENATVLEAFALTKHWIEKGIVTTLDMLFKPALIDLDFMTLKSTFASKSEKTLFGLGIGEGKKAVSKVLKSLKSCPLLHLPDSGMQAASLMVQITGGEALSMHAVNELLSNITEEFGSKQETLVGARIEPMLPREEIQVCILGSSQVFGKRVAFPKKRADEDSGDEPQLQDEFDFAGIQDQRGYFERSKQFLEEGEDLDVPTFLRKGIKIK